MPSGVNGVPLSDSSRLFLSSLAFGTGWLGLSFSFPLIAERLGFSYTFIGIIGLAGSLPFIVVSYIFRNATSLWLRLGTGISLTLLLVMSVALLFLYGRFFLEIAIVASLFQAPWWISNEIALGGFAGKKNAEKYSVGWGLPNAIAPLAMGLIIESLGFRYVFVVAIAAFIIAIFFTPRLNMVNVESSYGKPRLRYVFSLFFSGLFSGFLYYVMEPFMRTLSYPYYLIGVVISIYGFVVAAGFIVLNFTRELRIWQYSAISSLFIVPTVVMGFDSSPVMIVLVAVTSGLGVSISMSKVLSYISRTSDSRTGVFYYESTFGLGFIMGSLVEDVLFQDFGSVTIVLVFIWAMVYAIWLIATERGLGISHGGGMPSRR